MDSRFSLRWDNYTSQITDAFGALLLEEDLVDVTLSCEGKKIRAHKMLLSACSPYFHGIFKENPCQHPVIVFKNIQYVDLKAIVEFIYCGEVNVLQQQLESFLTTAETLEVKGLTERGNECEFRETSRVTMTNKENKKMDTERELEMNVSKKQVSKTRAAPSRNSPPVKKRKEYVEKLTDKDSVPFELTTVVKTEVEEIDSCDENVAESQVSDKVTSDISTLGKIFSSGENEFQGTGADTSEIAETLKDLPSEEVVEEEIECIDVDPPVEDQTSTLEKASPNIKLIESNSGVPLKKREKIPEEIILESEIPAKLEKKTPESKSAAAVEVKTAIPIKTSVKGKVQIPKGLVVTSIQATSQVENLFDFPAHEPQVQDEAYTALRSEEATTPVHEEPITYAHDTPMCENVSPGQNSDAEPEIAEEAPVLQGQTEPGESVEEEPKEPEFDYFGCEICKNEGKPVDLERINFSHKCPICPCCCFCAHLLKEHMKVMHGWFNVQRRFTHY